ncbi:MAG: sigma 54-interacting transcriptional regulator [Halioglobus sp.]
MSVVASDRIKVLIVGYRKFSELINALTPEFAEQAEITIVESVASKDVEYEDLIKQYQPDVVASAGSNAAYLNATLSVPVISQPVTDTDIIEALAKARRIAARVHIFTYHPESAAPQRLFSTLPQLLDIDLVHHNYSTSDEAAQRLLLAMAEEDMQVVVGPSFTCHMAEQRQMPAILIYSKESARELLHRAIDVGRAAHRVGALASSKDVPPTRFIIRSERMERVAHLARTYARSTGAVLLQGESGTGKEHVAHEIHRHSDYADGPLVAVNCGSIPHELFESELFGYVDGAFTSSRRGGRIGLVEQANGGVLYLDEVGEMPMQQQVKLLRVLQEKRIRPLGSNREVHLDFKVVAATNRDLRDSVASGEFRDDLYYRLNVLSLQLPPLRERADDITAIARYYIEQYSKQYGVLFESRALYAVVGDQFQAYGWPGNVRELQNFVERLVVNCAEDGVGSINDQRVHEILPELYAVPARADADGGALKLQEGQAILDAMARFKNDKARVAEYLGISSTTLWRRLKAIQSETEPVSKVVQVGSKP